MLFSQVCQYNTLEGKESQAVSLGSVTDVQFESVQDEYNFKLTITGGAPTKTTPSQQRYVLSVSYS